MARPPPARSSLRRDRPVARAALALVASLGVNGAALAALVAAGAFTLPSRPAHVALSAVAREVWDANRRVDSTPPAPIPVVGAAPPLAPRARPEVPSDRIVEVAPSSDPRRPKAARFLAERDNTVPRDVQYRGALAERRGPVAPRPTGGAPGSGGIPLPGEEGTGDAPAPGREGPSAAADLTETRIAAARLALAVGGERAGETDPGDPAAAGSRGEGGARRRGRFDPRLLPVGHRFEGVGGGSPMAERLPGVALGDETALNTRAFRYADFYRRVAEAIRSEWDPNRAWDGLDPHDRVFGRAARRVAVDIVLDRSGRLVATKVASTSGLPFFDREALRAIDAAAPFPNPPDGLVNGDGHVVLERYGLRFEFPEHAFIDRLMGAGGR
jgi:TonB family protein